MNDKIVKGRNWYVPNPLLKGNKNPNWNGGIAGYPNHYEMKLARLYKMAENPVCEKCKRKKAKHIHHKDFSKDNHAIENLLCVCTKCHGKIHKEHNKTNIKKYKLPKEKTSKYIRLYGYTLKELARKHNLSTTTILNCFKNNIPFNQFEIDSNNYYIMTQKKEN